MMIRNLFLLCLVVALLAGAGLGYLLFSSYRGFEKEVFVDIPLGTSTEDIADLLVKAGVIRNPWQIYAARLLEGKTLKAGEYRFEGPASAWDVYDKIARGDIFYRELLVPEGSNIFDIAALLDRAKLIGSSAFLKVAASPALVRDLDPKAPSLEGYLFPATYRITKHTTAVQLAKDMTDRFRVAWKELGSGMGRVHNAVTLASLVEKETALPAERPNVASVFRNRLERNVPLDCDPTTIYAALIEKRYRGTIHRSDLESTNLYNTYKHAGLPPGPIASPGLASLKAALQPADTEYLYFVARADGSGGHRFSATLEEHNAAVQEYRRGRKR